MQDEQSATIIPETMKAHCPRCDGERVCDIHGKHDQPFEFGDEGHHDRGQMDHRLLQCRGCETVFYWKSSWDTQSYDHHYNNVTGEEELQVDVRTQTYPFPEKKSARPDWVWALYRTDIVLSKIMDEVYQAADLRAFILASVGLRTALDRSAEILEIEPAISMIEKVSALLKGGWIGETESENLLVVAEAGNAAAHRGWSPEEEDFRPLLTTLEHFIERAILTGKSAQKVSSKIPAKPKRPKS